MAEYKKVYLDTQVISQCVDNEETRRKILQKQKTMKFFYSPAHGEEMMNFKSNLEKRNKEIEFIIKIAGNRAVYPDNKGGNVCLTEKNFFDCLNECKNSFGGEAITKAVEEKDKELIREYRNKIFGSLTEKKRKRIITLINAIPVKDIFNSKFSNVIEEKIKDMHLTPSDYTIENFCKTLGLFDWYEIDEYADKPFVFCLAEGNCTLDCKEKIIEVLMKYLDCIRWHADTNAYIGNTKDNNVKHGLTHDISHVLYASAVDIFVSEDRGLRYRAKATYNCLGINTEVVDLKGFLWDKHQ